VVAQSSLILEVAGAKCELTTGDSIYFIADVPHSYQDSGNSPELAYLGMRYPQPVNY
jgi:quercetin dioxygenase-like cupin family protein